MRLNRVNLEKDSDEKEKYNEKEEEEEEEDEENNEKKKSSKREIKEEEEMEGEEIENDDNNKKKMIANSKFEKVNGKKLIKIPTCPPTPYIDKNKTLLKIMIAIVVIFISLLIIVNVVVAIVKSRKKINMKGVKFMNDEIRILNDMDMLRFSKLKDDLIIAYCTEGVINLNKFYEENINQKTYSNPDSALTNVHVSISFSDACVDEIIKHLSSLLEHKSSSTFLHVHIMNADNFTLVTFSKIMNMVHKINNNTEIIMYNANHVREDFKIREDKGPLFYIDYARLNVFKEIKDVQKIIMLKLDNLMIEKDLADLYNIDMSDIYGRGISEVPSIRHSVDWMDPYLFDKSHFINDAVILVNLELCQKDNFYNKSIELNNNEFYTKTEDPTQDILNVLMRKKIEFFSPKFNKINFYEKEEDKKDESKWYPWVAETMKYGEKNNHFYTKEDLLNADSDPVIINYLWEKKLEKKVKKYEDEIEKYTKINGL